jgi:hypothetical protein
MLVKVLLVDQIEARLESEGCVAIKGLHIVFKKPETTEKCGKTTLQARECEMRGISLLETTWRRYMRSE